MLKSIQSFMQRLSERLAAMIASMFSSTVETMHALSQAEQQSQLEDAARKYEEEGKTEIAAALRQRASGLTSDNPASEGVAILDNLNAGHDRPQPAALQQPEHGQAPALPLPDYNQSQPKRTRRKNSSGDQPTN